MWEYPIARAYADARVVKIAGGSIEVMKHIIGRDLVQRVIGGTTESPFAQQDSRTAAGAAGDGSLRSQDDLGGKSGDAGSHVGMGLNR